MARVFPEIVAYGSAFRFAIEAEAACADLATAAAQEAPDDAWRAKLAEVASSHRERVQKLTVIRQEVNEMILEPIHSLKGGDYLGAVDKDPAKGWPGVVLQLISAERGCARYHEDFVTKCGDVLAASARAFDKAARQDRTTANELSELL